MNKFKVGDKVRLCKEEYAGLKLGDIGIVSDGHGSPGWFNINGIGDFHFSKGMEENDKRWELVKLQKLTYIIIYDLEDKDPIVYCYSKTEMVKKVKELYKDDKVVKESIRIIEVKKELKPDISVSIKEVK